MALRLGEIVLDRYVLHAKLGAGGFGAVWQGVDRVERRPVAVKELRSPDDANRRRFGVEAAVLAKLDHPNILKLYDFTAREDGTLLLVTELLGNETLADWFGERPDVDEILVVGRQLCAALGAAHREGVLHRDLKPSNVLFERDLAGHPKITVVDFGLAKLVGLEQTDITKTGVLLGTPGYMSPEQLRGLELGPATDLYCLGLLLFEMLEGKPAFTGETPLEIGMAHLTEPAPRVTRGPTALRVLVTKLLDKNPARRPGSALVVDRTLAEIQHGTHQPHEIEVTESDRRRPRWTLVVLLAVGLVAVAAAIALDSDEPPSRSTVPVNPSPGFLKDDRDSTPPPDSVADMAQPELHDQGAGGTAGCAERVPAATGTQRVLKKFSWLAPRPLLHYVPSSYDGRTPMPVVFLFHRRGTTAEQALDETGFIEVAEEHGFIVAAPKSRRGIDRVPFVGLDRPELLARFGDVQDALCIDASRIYLVGLSEGLGATEMFLCEHPGTIAAVASSGPRLSSAESCRKEGTADIVPRLEFVDERDRYVPIAGGNPLSPCPESTAEYMPLDEYEAFTRTQHGCSGPVRVVEPGHDGADCRTWTCDVPYRVCSIDAGRFWSRQPWQRSQHDCHGEANDVPRARIAWEFLSEFRTE